MGTGRQYDEKFKLEAIKLSKEVGIKKAAEELGIPKNTLKLHPELKGAVIHSDRGSQ